MQTTQIWHDELHHCGIDVCFKSPLNFHTEHALTNITQMKRKELFTLRFTTVNLALDLCGCWVRTLCLNQCMCVPLLLVCLTSEHHISNVVPYLVHTKGKSILEAHQRSLRVILGSTVNVLLGTLLFENEIEATLTFSISLSMFEFVEYWLQSFLWIPLCDIKPFPVFHTGSYSRCCPF